LYRPAVGLTSLGRPQGLTPGSFALQLMVNGEERSFDAIGVLSDLVASLGLDQRKVAVERNLQIVPRSAYAATALSDGDRIEIVHFIGGG
jgi:sulfur carrier protein